MLYRLGDESFQWVRSIFKALSTEYPVTDQSQIKHNLLLTQDLATRREHIPRWGSSIWWSCRFSVRFFFSFLQFNYSLQPKCAIKRCSLDQGRAFGGLVNAKFYAGVNLTLEPPKVGRLPSATEHPLINFCSPNWSRINNQTLFMPQIARPATGLKAVEKFERNSLMGSKSL